jgi:hypothetical protein
MKLLLACLLLSCISTSAQLTDEPKVNKDNQYAGVRGHPFLQDEWVVGTIRFSSGRVMDQFKLKFDIAQNLLLLQFSGSSFAAESKVNEFVMYPKGKKSKDSLVFKKGFPKVDQNDGETFYHILSEGTIKLLRYPRKVISEEKKLVTAVNRSFEYEEYFYLVKAGELIKINDPKSSIVDLLGDHVDELKKFIADNQLRMRTGEDLAKVVGKYNELQ